MINRHIIFELNNDYCAIAINDLLEIKTLDTMFRTHNTELNVIVWEEKSLPVIDPFAMLTLKENKTTPKSRIAIVEREGKEFGILFDSVMGTLDINMDKISEPMLNEPRYVNGIYEDKIKIFRPESLLTKKNIEGFEKIYEINLYEFENEKAARVHGIRAGGKDEIVDGVKLKALNWLVKATRIDVEKEFVEEVIEIHDLISQLD